MAPKEKKAKPLGKAIQWDDDALDEIAEITPADIEAAKMVVAVASPQLAVILDAKPVEGKVGEDAN